MNAKICGQSLLETNLLLPGLIWKTFYLVIIPVGFKLVSRPSWPPIESILRRKQKTVTDICERPVIEKLAQNRSTKTDSNLHWKYWSCFMVCRHIKSLFLSHRSSLTPRNAAINTSSSRLDCNIDRSQLLLSPSVPSRLNNVLIWRAVLLPHKPKVPC